MRRAHQPGSQPIDIPEVIPNPAVVPKPEPAPREPAPKEPVKIPEEVPAGIVLPAAGSATLQRQVVTRRPCSNLGCVVERESPTPRPWGSAQKKRSLEFSLEMQQSRAALLARSVYQINARRGADDGRSDVRHESGVRFPAAPQSLEATGESAFADLPATESGDPARLPVETLARTMIRRADSSFLFQ